MVHADSSNFLAGVSKQDAYDQVYEQAAALFEGQRNWVCNLSNAASLLWHAYKALPEPSKSVNWAGFYVLDRTTSDQLILGPFQGKVACQLIKFGKGVCGAAAGTQKVQLVPNVEEFPGHIACDGDSKSEIVVPILKEKKDRYGQSIPGTPDVVGIIDIDCAELNGFDDIDRKGLLKLAGLLSQSCDW